MLQLGFDRYPIHWERIVHSSHAEWSTLSRVWRVFWLLIGRCSWRFLHQEHPYHSWIRRHWIVSWRHRFPWLRCSGSTDPLQNHQWHPVTWIPHSDHKSHLHHRYWSSHPWCLWSSRRVWFPSSWVSWTQLDPTHKEVWFDWDTPPTPWLLPTSCRSTLSFLNWTQRTN